MTQRQPIVYETTLPVRFGDLDPYGHVGAHEYLGYVVGSRWAYAQDVLKITPSEFIEKGVAFYMSRAELDFLRPIVGTPIVIIKSHVSETQDAKLSVPFTIEASAENGSKIFCKGILQFVVMDLKTMRPQSLPQWVEKYFSMIEPAKYYDIMEEPFRALCPERSGFMNFGLWPAFSLKAAQTELVKATLQELKERKPDCQRILETGCGWGASRALVKELFPKAGYTGVNLSRKQLDHARQANMDVPDTLFVEAAVERLQREELNGTCDGLFAVEAAIHFDKKAFLTLAAGLGVQAISLAEIIVEDMPAVLANPYASPALHQCWSLEQYRQGLSDAGFRNLRIRDVSAASFPGMAANTRNIRTADFGESPAILKQLRQAFDDLEDLAAKGAVRYLILSAVQGPAS